MSPTGAELRESLHTIESDLMVELGEWIQLRQRIGRTAGYDPALIEKYNIVNIRMNCLLEDYYLQHVQLHVQEEQEGNVKH